MKRLLLFLLSVHVLSLLFLTAWRTGFLVAEWSEIATDTTPLIPAFVRGVWFDNVVMCYVMLLALVLLLIFSLISRYLGGLQRFLTWYLVVMFALVSMASAANIPYFDYFSKTLNSSIWQWFIYPKQTAGMLFGERSWWIYIGMYFAGLFFYTLAVRHLSLRMAAEKEQVEPWRTRWRWILAEAALIGLCVFGMRGRTGYNPIKVSAAYYCDNTVLNQMGINPAFSLLQTTLDDLRPDNKTLHLMDEAKAVRNVQDWLGRSGLEGISPLACEVTPAGEVRKMNVVIVLMESMSANLMGHFGNDKGLTPTLDSLYANGLGFRNFYSAGNHTNHGLYATLYSFPSIMKRNAMKGSSIPVYDGLPGVLREKGYSTLFFMTHESQYDNMNAFFRTNGYEEIYSQENYPKDRIANHFGVPDDYLFEYALPILRRKAESGQPFFATLLTISNHPPYVIQPYFTPKTKDPEDQIVEYADWSVRRFMQEAAKEKWFRNTIFVFLGDHGKKMGDTQYEVAESFNHIPLIIYCPALLAAEERTDFSGQIDVAPTILGLLNLPYTQNNFGIDLTKQQRDRIFYTADAVVAARDANYLYVYNPEVGKEFAYDVSTTDFRPLPTKPLAPELKRLKDYVFSNLQAAESLVQKGMTRNRKH